MPNKKGGKKYKQYKKNYHSNDIVIKQTDTEAYSIGFPDSESTTTPDTSQIAGLPPRPPPCHPCAVKIETDKMKMIKLKLQNIRFFTLFPFIKNYIN